jgi:hypothetical protein
LIFFHPRDNPVSLAHGQAILANAGSHFGRPIR